MSRLQCGCVYADAKNTPAVRGGHEVSGYLKQACAQHSMEPENGDDLRTEAGTLWAMLAKHGVEPTDDYIGLLSMHVIAVQEREQAYAELAALRSSIAPVVWRKE